MITSGLKRSAALVPFAASVFLVSACVPQSRYDYLEGQYNQLQQQTVSMSGEIATIKTKVDADEQHIARLQGAIKYTVNSDLLFASGSWQMSASGQEIIAKLAPQLAPYQEQKIVVNGYTDDAPVGAALRKQGITTNEMLSQKRAETVMQYLISKGVKASLVSAQGFGAAQPVAPNNTAQGRAEN